MREAHFAVDSDAPNQFPARAAYDARADNGWRRILLAQRCVRIIRRLQGVKMHLLVPVKSYAGVVLSCEEHPCGVVFSLRLAHRDPELSVTLGTASSRSASVAAWRQWVAYFSMPALIERSSGVWEIIEALPRPEASSPPPLDHHCTKASPKRRLRSAPFRKRGRTRRQAKAFRDCRIVRLSVRNE
jgi:hypothetical protein